MKQRVVPKIRQEVTLKVDIVITDDIKIYYSGKFQDFTARYVYIFSLVHIKTFEKDKLNVTQNIKFVFNMVQIIARKKKKILAFSIFALTRYDF